MTRRLPVFVSLAFLVFAASPALAQGPYAGGGVGRTLFGTEVKGLIGQVRTKADFCEKLGAGVLAGKSVGDDGEAPEEQKAHAVSRPPRCGC